MTAAKRLQLTVAPYRRRSPARVTVALEAGGSFMRAVPFTFAVVLLAAALPAAAFHRDEPVASVVRCESGDGLTRECAVDSRGGVRFVKQLSHGRCVEGQTWGIGRDSVWVTGGCRAEFVTYSGYGDDRLGRRDAARTVSCGSDSGRWNHCAADTRRGVSLVKQTSRSQCIRGQSWGEDARGIWVSGGCRADFRLGNANGGENPSAIRFKCESSDGSQRHCSSRYRGDIRIVRQLSHSACIEGDTWGQDRDGVWVSRGCRAEFEVIDG